MKSSERSNATSPPEPANSTPQTAPADSEAAKLAALNKSLKAKRGRSKVPAKPKPNVPPPVPSGDLIDRRLAENERFEAERLRREHDRRIQNAMDDFQRVRGRRYVQCTFESFQCETPEATAAVAMLREYASEIASQVNLGAGVLLYGPPGTGKDHLVTCLVREAITAGIGVFWVNGMELYAGIRDAIGKGESEGDECRKLVAPDVLVLSDPLPPAGTLTEFQAATLFRVIDGRYSQRKATWVTANIASYEEFSMRLGAQNADRLRDGAWVANCNWPSFRKVARRAVE